MLDTLKTLCQLDGVSGWEDEVRDYILERVMPYAASVETDSRSCVPSMSSDAAKRGPLAKLEGA